MVAWLKKVRLVARLQMVDDVASLLPLYLEGDALALYMEMPEKDQQDISKIEARLKEAFTDGAFSAYRKLTLVKWEGERVDVYANRIRQLVGLAGFEGVGLDRLARLAFVMGFPDYISVELQQAPNVETLTMADLMSRARVLTTRDENRDVAAAVRTDTSASQQAGSTTKYSQVPRKGPVCYTCGGPNHFSRDCQSQRNSGPMKTRAHGKIRCYRCNGLGHVSRSCPGNGCGDEALSPPLSPSSQ